MTRYIACLEVSVYHRIRSSVRIQSRVLKCFYAIHREMYGTTSGLSIHSVHSMLFILFNASPVSYSLHWIEVIQWIIQRLW